MVLSIENFPCLIQLKHVIMLQHFIIQRLFYYLSSGRLREVKNKRLAFKFFALKVVAVGYERWSLTRGSKYSDLAWKLLVFC